MALALLMAGPLHAQDSKKPTKPQTKQTQFISQAVFKDLEKAQQAIDAKDYAGAITALDVVKAKGDKLNDYERATLFNLYAAVYYNLDDTPKAIASYIEVLKTPDLPEGLRDSTLFALAQMYFVTEDYPKAIQVLNQWFKTVPEPSADAYVLLAQAHYQLEDFKKAETALIDALKLAKQKQQAPKENWLALLRAVYYELGDYAKAAKVLEILVAAYPSESYVLQLSGMYGLMGEQKKQLATLHAGYLGGMVTSKGDLLNLARLYLVEDVPYPAVQLLTKAFKDEAIEPDAETLQLYAQALALAQERDAQIPVLKRLADLTGESKHYAFLGQAQAEAGNWSEAISAFQMALQGKDVDDASGIRMQLGTAQFNAGRLSDARRTFIAASESDKHGETASNWIKFVGAEIERKRVLEQDPATAPQPIEPEIQDDNEAVAQPAEIEHAAPVTEGRADETAHAYLAPGDCIDSDHADIQTFARDRAGDGDDRQRAVRLYYAVRDEIRYDPYRFSLDPVHLRASATLAAGSGFCVPKAGLLAACARAKGIPARIGLADVKKSPGTANA